MSEVYSVCPGPYGGPTKGALSYKRGTPVRRGRRVLGTDSGAATHGADPSLDISLKRTSRVVWGGSVVAVRVRKLLCISCEQEKWSGCVFIV